MTIAPGRPDIASLGLEEVEPGYVLDALDNRLTLRMAGLQWKREPGIIQTEDGAEKGVTLLRVIDPEVEQTLIWERRKLLLVDPRNKNSPYLTGQDLLDDYSAIDLAPAWVVGSTKRSLATAAALEERAANPAAPPPTGTELTLAARMPERCHYVKTDGTRCWNWSPMLPGKKDLCQTHARVAGEIWYAERGLDEARRVIIEAAPNAAETLAFLMTEAKSENVRKDSANSILDRAGVRGGVDVTLDAHVTTRDASAEVRARLERLAETAARVIRAPGGELEDAVDAEIIDGETDEGEGQQ